ncbi:MAG: hypothetical protein LAP85_15275 [Acidobacteriia bacterium]|nr:hypothetical protein [Terriglobia bacterium]
MKNTQAPQMTVDQKVRAARKAIDRLMMAEADLIDRMDCEVAAFLTVRRFRSVLRSLHLSFRQFADAMDDLIRIELSRGNDSVALDQFYFCTAA